MTSITDIRAAIISGSFSNDELEAIAQAVKYARTQLGRKTARTLAAGDAVKFTDPRNGRVFTGTVDKVKIKYVLVKTNIGRYNVPASMLEPV